MTKGEKVLKAIEYSGNTRRSIAEKMGVSTQYIHTSIAQNSFSNKKLAEMARIMGAEFEYKYSFDGMQTNEYLIFEFEDGTVI